MPTIECCCEVPNAAVIIHNVQTNIYASGTRDVSIYAVQFAVGVHDVCVHDVCVCVYTCAAMRARYLAWKRCFSFRASCG